MKTAFYLCGLLKFPNSKLTITGNTKQILTEKHSTKDLVCTPQNYQSYQKQGKSEKQL